MKKMCLLIIGLAFIFAFSHTSCEIHSEGENPAIENTDSSNTQNPDSGNTDKPDSGTTDNPNSGTTDNPDKPDSGNTDKPDIGNTDKPDSGNTDNPGNDDEPVTPNPSWVYNDLNIQKFHKLGITGKGIKIAVGDGNSNKVPTDEKMNIVGANINGTDTKDHIYGTISVMAIK